MELDAQDAHVAELKPSSIELEQNLEQSLSHVNVAEYKYFACMMRYRC